MPAHSANMLLRRNYATALFPTALIFSVTVALMLLMLSVVPSYEKIYADYGTELPIVTKKVVNLSRWLGGRLTPDQVIPGSAWVVLGGVSLLSFQVWRLVTSRSQPEEPRYSILALWLVVGLSMLAAVGACTVALFLPFVRGIKSLT